MDKRLTEWKMFNTIGAICVFSAMLVMLVEIFLTALPDGAHVLMTSQQLLEMYNRNWFMGMRNMGLMNIIASSLMIPVFYCLYGAHKEKSKALAGFALLIAVMGYSVFLSDNVSFPILEISKKYAIALESEKMLFIAATETLVAEGASHTPGTFPGLLLIQLGNILFCIAMIKGAVFKKSTGIIGIVAFAFLIIFEILSSFFNSLYQPTMIFAMIGGISALVWYFKVGMELLKVKLEAY